MQVTAGCVSYDKLTHLTNDTSVNEVKVCSHRKVKSEITALSDANKTGNRGSAPFISVSVFTEGTQELF